MDAKKIHPTHQPEFLFIPVPMDARNFVQHPNRVLLFTRVPMDARNFMQHTQKQSSFVHPGSKGCKKLHPQCQQSHLLGCEEMHRFNCKKQESL
jgi:hypothetical protein